MTINEYSLVKKVNDANSFIPEIVYNFVKIDQLETYTKEKGFVGNASTLLIFYKSSLYITYLPFRCNWCCSSVINQRRYKKNQQEHCKM